MSLPIDEMLTDLRAVLEAFEAGPNDDTLGGVGNELNRIYATCEDEIPEDEDGR